MSLFGWLKPHVVVTLNNGEDGKSRWSARIPGRERVLCVSTVRGWLTESSARRNAREALRGYRVQFEHDSRLDVEDDE